MGKKSPLKDDFCKCFFIEKSFQIASKQKDLKKKLRVSFVGEPGLDMGGLTKEWFLLLIRDIFQVNLNGKAIWVGANKNAQQ